MKKLGLIAAALTAAGLAGQANAVGRLVDVSVYDRSEGRELRVYHRDGKYYVAGKPGNEYQVTLRNQGSEDLLGVTSVDGVNVITGESAAWHQSGYVLNPWNTTEIKGWRKNVNQVARFYFTDLPDSYAARTDRPDNVGVIGVAVFRRKAEPAYEDEYRWHDRGGESRAPARPRAQPYSESKRYTPRDDAHTEQELGTGHGRKERSEVRYTDFERASQRPDEVIKIYYDSHSNLVARGIVPEHRHYVRPHMPRAFPGFVSDPPRYRW